MTARTAAALPLGGIPLAPWSVGPVREDELDAVGALTAGAYLADGLLDGDDEYEAELRDARSRWRDASLLVARTDDGAVLGSLTVAPHGSPFAEVARPGEVELRMLAVDPAARGRGVAEELVRAALVRAVLDRRAGVVLSTLDSMLTAHRLYARLGFRPAPERDWDADDGFVLRVHTWSPPPAPGAAVERAVWPPLRTTTTAAGWTVGLSEGLTRRANSATPPPPADGVAGPDERDVATLLEGLDEVEAVYAAAALPTTVRVDGPLGAPTGPLSAALRARGYALRATTLVLVAALPAVPATALPPADGVTVTASPEPDDAWVRLWLAEKADGDGRAADVGRRLLTGAPAAYLTAWRSGAAVGVLRVAPADGWAALACLVVDPQERRRGTARRLVEAGLQHAAREGAARAFLQVEVENHAARRLYARWGFLPADAYHYAERP
ncbi:GNAT family N-acetyltransferase [Cellulomonas marina]|uniref:Acetyltransferase (GNAT) family protein n=1 Tax=Cellulomonas marina TaxID=988821 RepID=A0A1I0YL38_9CELL|nr:GNAT family N-acetyltransferase [Cellulomonas marina]GIG30822.1 hypothetical protein Cma02nite_34220 [Cellulomonas marina]SFB14044.1 Acetyltransferase (GNAT) family protein [Cellulomonas marina]